MHETQMRLKWSLEGGTYTHTHTHGKGREECHRDETGRTI